MANVWLIVGIIVISSLIAIVARAAKALQNMEETNAARNRQRARAARERKEDGTVVRQPNSDMDRFLAEIDRLRKKNVDSPAPPTKKPVPVAPVVQPAKSQERRRVRVVAEPVEPMRPDSGFTQPPPLPFTQPALGRLGDPMPSTVVSPPSGTGAPATRVTIIAGRPRPVAKTPFAKNITGLLNSGQGLAIAVVLQEILGPPHSKKR